MKKQGLILLPMMLMIACDEEDVANSPLKNDNTKNMAVQIEEQARLWVSKAIGEEMIAISITPMVDDFSIVIITLRKPDGSTYNKNLYAEKYNNHVGNRTDDDDEIEPIYESAWTVGYLDENVMKVMAKKYGFDQEVDKIAKETSGTEVAYNPAYSNSWLNQYLIWHMMFNRPMIIEKNYYTGNTYVSRPLGYRPYASNAPLMSKMNLGNAWSVPKASNGVSHSVTSGKGSFVSSGRAASVARSGFAAARGGSIGG